jgi:acyl-CoA synthetase (AMP-forming)/AMP-acid ligase II
VRGENLFHHYWKRPEATCKARDEAGFFRTGDLGFQSAEGELTLVGRQSDLIITNGYNVYPPVVERALNEHPLIEECAVVGVPDMRRGEKVVAFVVAVSPVGAEELQNHCRQRLVSYQRPLEYHEIEALPRNTMGKVLKRQLRASLRDR